jgi:hypothetical protein
VPQDDSSLLQGLLDAGVKPGVATIPPGSYRYTQTLRHPGSGVVVRGGGKGNTVLNYVGTGGYAYVFGRADMDRTVPARAANWPYCELHDVAFTGLSSVNALGGVRVYGATRYVVKGVRCEQFRAGAALELGSGWIGILEDLHLKDSLYGLWAKDPGAAGEQAFNGVDVRNGEIGPGCEVGLMVGAEDQAARRSPVLGTGLWVSKVTFEGARRWGVWLNEGNDVVLEANYFEANSKAPAPGKITGHVQVGNDLGVWCHTVVLKSNTFMGGPGTAPLSNFCSVYLNTARVAKVYAMNRFDTGGVGGAAVMYRDAAQADVPVADNFYAASVVNRKYVQSPVP